MERDFISQLVDGYLRRRYDSDTETRIQQWLVDEAHGAEKDASLMSFWETLPETQTEATHRSLAQLKSRLGMDGAVAHRFSFSRRIAAAAIFIPLLLLLGAYLYFKQSEGVSIAFSVPFGENREVNLPDGSTVFINAGSEIRYTEGRSGRRIALNGEAFFSVAKNEAKPFVVNTENISVTAIGTEFNVRAYAGDSKEAATLTSGIVIVKTKDSRNYTLSPNEQLLYEAAGNKASVQNVSAGEFSGWRKGDLIFDDMPLRDIVADIERRFDAKINADGVGTLDEHFSIKFVNGETLNELMELLCAVGELSYQRAEGEIKLYNR